MKWGPWINHDGNGMPGILTKGTVVRVQLLDPLYDWCVHGSYVFTIGKMECKDDVIFSDNLDYKSWTLPMSDGDIVGGILYVNKYQIMFDPGTEEEVEEYDLIEA